MVTKCGSRGDSNAMIARVGGVGTQRAALRDLRNVLSGFIAEGAFRYEDAQDARRDPLGLGLKGCHRRIRSKLESPRRERDSVRRDTTRVRPASKEKKPGERLVVVFTCIVGRFDEGGNDFDHSCANCPVTIEATYSIDCDDNVEAAQGTTRLSVAGARSVVSGFVGYTYTGPRRCPRTTATSVAQCE